MVRNNLKLCHTTMLTRQLLSIAPRPYLLTPLLKSPFTMFTLWWAWYHTYCAAAGEATCRSLAHSTNTVLSISPLRQVRNSVYKLGVYGWHGASWHRHGVVGALFTCILEYPVVLTRCILFRSSLTHALSVYNNAPSVNIISKPRRPFAGFLQHVEEQPQPDAHTGTNRSHGRPHACIVCGQPHRHFLFFESYEFLACGKRNS